MQIEITKREFYILARLIRSKVAPLNFSGEFRLSKAQAKRNSELREIQNKIKIILNVKVI